MNTLLRNLLAALHVYSLLAALILKRNDTAIFGDLNWAINQRHYPLAARLLSQLASRPQPDVQVGFAVDRLRRLVADLIQQRKFDRARQLLAILTQYEPFRCDYSTRLLHIAALEGLGPSAAVECLKRLVQVCGAYPNRPEHQPFISRLVTQPLQKVMQLRQAGKFKEALQWLTPFLQVDAYRNQKDLQFAHAECLFEVGRLEAALPILKTLHQANPADASIEALLNRVQTTLRNRKKMKMNVFIDEGHGRTSVLKNADLSVLDQLTGKHFSVQMTRGMRSYLGVIVSMLFFIGIAVALGFAQGLSSVQQMGLLQQTTLILALLAIGNWLWLFLPGARPCYEISVDTQDHARNSVVYVKQGVLSCSKTSLPLTEILDMDLERSFLDRLTGNTKLLVKVSKKPEPLLMISPLSPSDCEIFQTRFNKWVAMANPYRTGQFN